MRNALFKKYLKLNKLSDRTVVRISPHYRSRNDSIVPIGHKGRFLLLENKKNETKMQVNRTIN